MDIKELEKYVKHYGDIYTEFLNPTTTRVFSGKKQSGYFLPNMVIGGHNTVSAKLDWYVEIFINDRCIFRQYRMFRNNPEECEQQCVDSIVEDMMIGGIDSSRQVVEKNINSNE